VPHTSSVAPSASLMLTTATLNSAAISSTHTYTHTPQGHLAKAWTPPLVTVLNSVTQTAPLTTSDSYDADGN